MTAARRPRSAALLVGSTSGTSANVQSAGQSLSRFFASTRTCRCRFPVEPHSSNGNICILIAATCRWSAARSPFRLEAVVSAEAIGADDAGELVADQPVQVLLAAVGRDPQHRRLFAEGAPERARLAAQVPAGLIDVECRRCARL